jgi:hypothetical protein
VSPQRNSFKNFAFEPRFDASKFLYSANLRFAETIFDPHDRRPEEMDLFQKNRSLLPVEVVVAVAINIVIVVLGYYAVLMWGLMKG